MSLNIAVQQILFDVPALYGSHATVKEFALICHYVEVFSEDMWAGRATLTQPIMYTAFYLVLKWCSFTKGLLQ